MGLTRSGTDPAQRKTATSPNSKKFRTRKAVRPACPARGLSLSTFRFPSPAGSTAPWAQELYPSQPAARAPDRLQSSRCGCSLAGLPMVSGRTKNACAWCARYSLYSTPFCVQL